jgi:hypothetical protein
MAQVYPVVWDRAQVRTFFDLFLPSNPGMVLSCMLAARQKYDASLPPGTHNIRRFFVGGTASSQAGQIDNACVAVDQLECRLGAYCVKGAPLHSTSGLVLYGNIQPLSVELAMATCWQNSIVHSNCGDRGRLTLGDFNHVLESSRAPHKLRMLDVDTKDTQQLADTNALLERTGVAARVLLATETKNGFHVVYDGSKAKCSAQGIDHKALHDFMETTAVVGKVNVNGQPVADNWLSISKSGMVVIPGTLQGTWRVRITKLPLTPLVLDTPATVRQN